MPSIVFTLADVRLAELFKRLVSVVKRPFNGKEVVAGSLQEPAIVSSKLDTVAAGTTFCPLASKVAMSPLPSTAAMLPLLNDTVVTPLVSF
jgi:hypothetical protein